MTPPRFDTFGSFMREFVAVQRREVEGTERQFRRIIGYQQLATLALAIERELVLPAPTEEVAILITA